MFWNLQHFFKTHQNFIMWNFKAFVWELSEILCDISNNGYFNISNGRVMRSTKPILSIFKRNLSFIIIHHPAKFHQNRSRTFWDNRYTHSHTHTQTHTHTDTYTRIENNTCTKNKVFGPGNNSHTMRNVLSNCLNCILKFKKRLITNKISVLYVSSRTS